MNCDCIQRQLLAAKHPDRPPAEVEAHLALCPACRAWQNQLVGIEQRIRQMPVPPSRHGKRELFRKLHAGTGGEWESPQEDRVTCSHTQSIAASHSPTIHWHHTLTLVAAGLLVMVCGWWLLRSTPPPPQPLHARPKPRPEPLLVGLSERHLRLSQATTPREKVEELARMMDDLHNRTQALVPVAPVSSLQSLVPLYEQIVQDGVVSGARKVAPDQRRVVLSPLVEQLTRVGDEAEQWAQTAPAGAADPLQRIVLVARDGNRQLHKLLREGTP